MDVCEAQGDKLKEMKALSEEPGGFIVWAYVNTESLPPRIHAPGMT
jgi:hypothetical protein